MIVKVKASAASWIGSLYNMIMMLLFIYFFNSLQNVSPSNVTWNTTHFLPRDDASALVTKVAAPGCPALRADPLKLVLIAPGYTTLPPKGWGAVESVVWDYLQTLRRSWGGLVSVNVVNTPNLDSIVMETNGLNADIVHIMFDDYIVVAPFLKCSQILYTSHFAFITHPNFETDFPGYFQGIFLKVIEYSNLVILHSISQEIAEKYRQHGFKGRINVLPNGAREDLFRYTLEPRKRDKSIYLAKIENRKAQFRYQSIRDIEFVGNYAGSTFNLDAENYFGEWSKEVLYSNLTDFGNLVLLSEGEADPLVTKEALIAGLGVVVSECSVANLDVTKPFITVIPNERLHDLNYVSEKIIWNRNTSILLRPHIRKYALDFFSWDQIIRRYFGLLFAHQKNARQIDESKPTHRSSAITATKRVL
jgi:glycosyltransferase involved in cell wall biosynthesis